MINSSDNWEQPDHRKLNTNCDIRQGGPNPANSHSCHSDFFWRNILHSSFEKKNNGGHYLSNMSCISYIKWWPTILISAKQIQSQVISSKLHCEVTWKQNRNRYNERLLCRCYSEMSIFLMLMFTSLDCVSAKTCPCLCRGLRSSWGRWTCQVHVVEFTAVFLTGPSPEMSFMFWHRLHVLWHSVTLKPICKALHFQFLSCLRLTTLDLPTPGVESGRVE